VLGPTQSEAPAISSERERCGTYSESSVVVFGIAAPSPSPVSSRSAAISVRSWVTDVPTVNTPNSRTETVNTALRPNRSDAGPAINAPRTRPTGAALMTSPKLTRETPQSCRMDGARKPMIATSMPSIATTRKHSASSSHWIADIGRWSMNALTSTRVWSLMSCLLVIE
jgi:hypothetical protein